MLSLGVTTVEAKSGYGLSLDAELKQLEAYRLAEDRTPIHLIRTFLAHTIPAQFGRSREAYVDLILDDMLPAVKDGNLASFCDIFVEVSAFTIEEARRILTRAQDLGLGLKVHADQLSDSGGALLAAELNAVSADHLECISEQGIKAMAQSGTIAVSLPFASMYLGVAPLPARALISSGVPVAVATDFNPGSAPSFHLPFAMTLACVMQKMTPNETLKGATIVAARAIGHGHKVGSIETGKRADLIVVDAEDPAQWLYHLRSNAVSTVICNGKVERSGH
jgi:imidazolonepropionase